MIALEKEVENLRRELAKFNPGGRGLTL
jgi:hypothetical protein